MRTQINTHAATTAPLNLEDPVRRWINRRLHATESLSSHIAHGTIPHQPSTRDPTQMTSRSRSRTGGSSSTYATALLIVQEALTNRTQDMDLNQWPPTSCIARPPQLRHHTRCPVAHRESVPTLRELPQNLIEAVRKYNALNITSSPKSSFDVLQLYRQALQSLIRSP